MADVISVQKLTKRYDGHVGVEALDLSVEAGEVFGFLGANGAGKTTTIRCITGLLRPTSGSIRVLGLDPHRDRIEVMKKIGYLPGELRLYQDLSGRQHLELFENLQGSPSQTRRNQLCERVGLKQSDLDRPIRDYSRGMKQKIGIVQAFQHDPEVVILDEPTEGLDPLVQEAFFALLGEFGSKGGAVLLSSHVMSEVERTCNRVAVLRSGSLVTVDRVEALRNTRTRTVKLTFGDQVDKQSVETLLGAGIQQWSPEWTGSVLALAVEPAAVVAVLRSVLDAGVIDVVVEEAGLEDAVLSMYEGNQQ